MLLTGAVFYPFEVLTTNRILRSNAVDKPQSGLKLISQLRKLYKIGSLWRGFVPYVSSIFIKAAPINVAYGASKINDVAGSIIMTGFTTLVANPLEILATRYQHVDFNRGNLTQDLKRMWSKEDTTLFRTGFYHVLTRNLIFLFFMTQRMESPDSILSAILLATICSHPFEVLKSRQMWAATGGDAQRLAVGENVKTALKFVWKEEGIQGLYRGLAPRLLFYVLIGRALFSKEEKIRRGQS